MPLFDRLFGSSSGKNKPGKGESQPQGVPDRFAVIKKLIKMMNNDPSERVRLGATDALGNIGDPSAVLPLYQAIYSGRTDTRGIQALGQIGDANAIKYLELIAADKKLRFGSNVATNVLKWKRHPEVTAVNKPASPEKKADPIPGEAINNVDRLVELLTEDSKKYDLRSRAAEALCELGEQP